MKIESFTGKEGIKCLFEKALNSKEMQLRTALVDKPLVYLAGERFSQEYMTQRKSIGIFLKSLRFTHENVDKPEHTNYASYKKAVRVAPKEISLKHSVVISDDFVALINSKELSGVIIENKEHSDLMKEWFDFIWLHSK